MKVRIELDHEDVKQAVVEYIKARHGLAITADDLVPVDNDGNELNASEEEGFAVDVDETHVIAKILEN